MTEKSSVRLVRIPRVVFAITLMFAMVLTAFAPQVAGAQDPTETDANVRIVHASPDAPAVDVIIDGAVVASDLSFGEVTDFMSVSPSSHQIQVVPAGSDAASAVIDTEFDPDSGKGYIIAAAGLLADIEAKVYDVDMDNLDSNQSRLRAINLSPADGTMDVYQTGGDELFGDIGFGDSSDYEDIDAGSYDLEVRPHDQATVAVSLPGFQVAAGSAYALLILGLASDNSLQVLPLSTAVETHCSTVLGVGSPDDACVRVAHASPDAPPIDVYVNDSLIVEGLEFGNSTDFIALPEGDDREVKIVPSGSPIDNAVFDTNVDLVSGHAYELIAVDMIEDIDAMWEDVDLSPLPQDQSRVRVVHASPDVDGIDVVVTDGPDLFNGVNFKDATDYQTLDATTYDIQVKQGDDVLIRVTDLVVEPNTVYDLVAMGRADDGSLKLVALTAPAAASAGPGDAAASPAATPIVLEEESPEVLGTPAG